MIYYLMDCENDEVIVALPSKGDIEFLAGVYYNHGRDVYVSHLALVMVA